MLKSKYDELKLKLKNHESETWYETWYEIHQEIIRSLTIEPVELRSKVTELEATVCRLEAEKLELMKSIRSQMRADIMLELIDSLHDDNNLVAEWVKFKEGYVRVEE